MRKSNFARCGFNLHSWKKRVSSCEVDNAEWYKPQLNEVGSVWLGPSAEMGRQLSADKENVLGKLLLLDCETWYRGYRRACREHRGYL